MQSIKQDCLIALRRDRKVPHTWLSARTDWLICQSCVGPRHFCRRRWLVKIQVSLNKKESRNGLNTRACLVDRKDLFFSCALLNSQMLSSYVCEKAWMILAVAAMKKSCIPSFLDALKKNVWKMAHQICHFRPCENKSQPVYSASFGKCQSERKTLLGNYHSLSNIVRSIKSPLSRERGRIWTTSQKEDNGDAGCFPE